MIVHRPASARGHVTFDWLDTFHTFSFGHYHDPEHMGHGPLRVINDDRIAANTGFPTHGHSDMEIITYVLSGALSHKDSLGTGASITAGEVQRMSAGSGIRHSEYNASPDTPVHLLQIWIMSDKNGVTPSYDQKDFRDRRAPGRLTPLVTPDGRDGTLAIHQDATMSVLDLDAGGSGEVTFTAPRLGWVHVARGALTLDGKPLVEGDGIAITGAETLRFTATESSEILVFDLPQ